MTSLSRTVRKNAALETRDLAEYGVARFRDQIFDSAWLCGGGVGPRDGRRSLPIELAVILDGFLVTCVRPATGLLEPLAS